MTTVTIPERILMKEGVKTVQFTLIFVATHPTLKKYCETRAGTTVHKQLQ